VASRWRAAAHQRLEALSHIRRTGALTCVLARPAGRYQLLAIPTAARMAPMARASLRMVRARGSRPEFTVVTGASPGGPIGPFAFLGPSYDLVLKNLFFREDRRGTAAIRWLSAIFGARVFKAEPLRRPIARHVDDVLLERIGIEY
jgi:hypothetical protein